ncbi:hypothetical protein, variant [Aphanomyces invadans]|uniref:Uncharacterized protein n=1 Tax=Aphanomyces invadans TaxID=157072 RepID=A0A024UTM8_9STRA|nr:hypothetical protein, variant [Aphanomyces invadans]ETW09315.1 hypothetical protein, variant [Aphanomyces invadans]|eukprot:XP_008863120.1 hypothetical protein, variant [Aphanomyces invadans]
MATTWASLQARLQSTVDYEQSDAASDLFDFWFSLAADFAQTGSNIVIMQRNTRQALEIIFDTYPVQRIRDPSTDLYAARELFRHAQAIFEILRTKPKFTALLDPFLIDTMHDPSVNSLSLYLATTGVHSLELVAYGDNIHSGTRVDAIATLESLLELWEFLAAGPWAHSYSPSPSQSFSPGCVLTFQLAHLAQTISSVSTDSIVRDVAIVLLQRIARFDTSYAPVIALSRVARDVLALSPLWSMGVLASSAAMENLMSKVVATSTEHAAAKALYCTAVMESLYEALMNHRSSREWAFNADVHEARLTQLFHACLHTYKLHPNEANRAVLPDAYLHAMESILLNYPDCVGIVQFALDTNEYGMVALIGRTAHVFAPAVWTDLVLPFARAQLALLPLQGVSGNQRDQEIVNLVREACRLYYLNIDRVPPPLLGRNVFLTVIQAIRHGYIETERFTEILALILHRHYSMGHVQVYQWLPTLLLPEVAHNHKTRRALVEAVLIALGLQNSAFGLENAVMSAETSRAISDAFSVIVAKLRTGPADMLWHEICLNFGPFVHEHRSALAALLHSIGLELDACASRGVIAVDRLESLTELLYAMSTRIDASDAIAVVQLSLQVIQLGAGAITSNMFEGTLVNALDLLSDKDNGLDLVTTELALSVCGPRTRAALARHVPHLCLEDVDPMVRQAALRYMLPRPDLIRAHSLAVIRSLYWIHNPMFKAEDASAKLCVDQLALATEACPVLVVLAEVSPLYVKECVLKLLSAANISAVNDPLSEAKFILPHLDRLATNVPRNALIRLVLSPAGISLLPLLVFLSAKWQQLVQEMMQSGFVVESTDASSATDASEFSKLDRMMRMNRRGATPRTFHCTVLGRDTLTQLLGSETADTAHNVPSRNQLHHLIVAEHEKGGFMKALRLANTMRAWYPDDYVELGTHTLVLQVKDAHFPRMSMNGFAPSTLEAFSTYYRIMHEVKLLFPVESESILQLSTLLDALCLAKLHEVIAICGCDAARTWMDLHGFHSATAAAALQEASRAVVKPPLPFIPSAVPLPMAAPVQPSAPLWVETMLHVLDGDLPALALDSITLTE